MDDLADLYRRKLNLPNAVFTYIDHEDAMVAAVFKISQSGSPDLILKICSRKGDFLRESYCLNRFAGKIPVPKIVRLIEPEEGLDGAVLMEYVHGDLLKSEAISNALAWEIGSLLARIHLEHAEGYGDLTDPARLSVDPRIPFTMKFEEGLEECKNSFLEGYASIRKVPDYQPLMPLLHLSRAVAAVGFTVKRGTWESRNSKLYQFSRRHLESLTAGEGH